MTDVYVADIATGTERVLASGLPENWNPNGGFEWSTDGQRIAFYFQPSGQPSSVWIADVPSPALPRIVAACEQGGSRYTLDSNGTVYFFENGTPGSGGISVSNQGNMFGGNPAPSPVMSMDYDLARLVVILQNGDVWVMSGLASSPPHQGQYSGNVFTAAGVTSVAPTSTPPRNQMASPRPNPFSPNLATTRMSASVEVPFTTAIAGKVTLRVFDLSGRLVRTLENGIRPPGTWAARWDGLTDSGTLAASGTYFLRITNPDGTQDQKKVTLLK